jgi:hypothetical protein
VVVCDSRELDHLLEIAVEVDEESVENRTGSQAPTREFKLRAVHE